MESISKPTSRVTAPPGGKTNFSLGGYGEDQAPAPRKQNAAEVDAERQRAEAQAKQDLYKPSPPQAIRPAVGHNPVTGEDPGASQGDSGLTRGQRAKPAKIDPASMPAAGGRVGDRPPINRQPPGGRGSGIFDGK